MSSIYCELGRSETQKQGHNAMLHSETCSAHIYLIKSQSLRFKPCHDSDFISVNHGALTTIFNTNYEHTKSQSDVIKCVQ